MVRTTVLLGIATFSLLVISIILGYLSSKNYSLINYHKTAAALTLISAAIHASFVLGLF